MRVKDKGRIEILRSSQPFGKALLWLVAVGLVALALWQASEAIWGYHKRDGAKRVRKHSLCHSGAGAGRVEDVDRHVRVLAAESGRGRRGTVTRSAGQPGMNG